MGGYAAEVSLENYVEFYISCFDSLRSLYKKDYGKKKQRVVLNKKKIERCISAEPRNVQIESKADTSLDKN